MSRNYVPAKIQIHKDSFGRFYINEPYYFTQEVLEQGYLKQQSATLPQKPQLFAEITNSTDSTVT